MPKLLALITRSVNRQNSPGLPGEMLWKKILDLSGEPNAGNGVSAFGNDQRMN
jgi:hypothetical protein